jgi:hypothetical protein
MGHGIKELQVAVADANQFRVENYPNAAHLAAAEGASADRLRDFWLALQDTKQAHACLTKSLSLLRSPETTVVKDALWFTAVTVYVRCFASGVRETLKPEEVFVGDLVAVHQYFYQLRNKHMAHDVNAFRQCVVGVVVNPEDAACKIADAVALPVLFPTNQGENEGNLLKLIAVTQEWLEERISALFRQVCGEYETKERAELMRLSPPQLTVPSLADVEQRRPRP